MDVPPLTSPQPCAKSPENKFFRDDRPNPDTIFTPLLAYEPDDGFHNSSQNCNITARHHQSVSQHSTCTLNWPSYHQPNGCNDHSTAWSLTTFEPKWSKQWACNAKAQKGVDWELELELEKREEMHKETASVGLQKGADGLSFTMVCVPVCMHGHPRVRDNHMAAVL